MNLCYIYVCWVLFLSQREVLYPILINSIQSDIGETFSNILDANVFERESIGYKIMKLSRAETELFSRLPLNGSSLAYLLISQPDSVPLSGLSVEKLQVIKNAFLLNIET